MFLYKTGNFIVKTKQNKSLKYNCSYGYSMKYITTILRKFVPKELPKTLGRWNIEQCNTKMNHKIDLSNEDHCGPCGQYALTKIELQMKKHRTKDDIQK